MHIYTCQNVSSYTLRFVHYIVHTSIKKQERRFMVLKLQKVLRGTDEGFITGYIFCLKNISNMLQ